MVWSRSVYMVWSRSVYMVYMHYNHAECNLTTPALFVYVSSSTPQPHALHAMRRATRSHFIHIHIRIHIHLHTYIHTYNTYIYI